MKKYLLYLLLASLIIAILFAFHFTKKTAPSSGTVIVLNGPSASGKSSIQRAFQELMMPNLWVKAGIDNLFDSVMPDITLDNIHFWQNPNPIRWVETTHDTTGNPIITLFTGKQGEEVAYAMNSAIVAYAQNGCNVIVDYIAYKKEWLDDLRNKLRDIETYYVAVRIPLEILEQREAARKTSPQGHARSHYFDVLHDSELEYDMSVYPDKYSAQDIAQQLKHHIERWKPLGGPRP